MKKWQKILLWATFLALTPYAFRIANLHRGYDAIGGEIFVPLLPLLIIALVDTAKDFNKKPRAERG